MGKESNILNPSMPGKTVGSYIWGIAVFGYSYIVNEKKQQPVFKTFGLHIFIKYI